MPLFNMFTKRLHFRKMVAIPLFGTQWRCSSVLSYKFVFELWRASGVYNCICMVSVDCLGPLRMLTWSFDHPHYVMQSTSFYYFVGWLKASNQILLLNIQLDSVVTHTVLPTALLEGFFCIQAINQIFISPCRLLSHRFVLLLSPSFIYISLQTLSHKC